MKPGRRQPPTASGKATPPPSRPGGAGAGGRRELPPTVVRWVLASVLGFIGVLALWVQLRPAPQTPPAANSTPPGVIPAAALARYHELDDRRRVWDETIWAPEILAQAHEEFFVQLWDRLNQASDPWEILGAVDFAELRLGTPGTAQTLPDGIQITPLSTPANPLTPADWRARVAAWRSAGWRVTNSEWRMRRFDPPTNGAPAQAVIACSLNLENTPLNQRAVARGDLRVVCAVPVDPNPGAPPAPRILDATTGWEILTRTGDPGFAETAHWSVSPEPKSSYVDPVIVYDLDGDGWPEIILACKNLVFWNHQGAFGPGEPLCAQPPRLIHTALVADFDGDGRADFLCADRDGLLLFPGDATGRFPGAGRRVWRSPAPLVFAEVMTAGDTTGGGALDVWLGQYQPPHIGGQMPTPYYNANDSYPAYFLRNDGTGNFRDATAAAGLAGHRNRRSYSASFVDLADTGRPDLIVVSDFAGVDSYRNDGHGQFTPAPAVALPDARLFGMAHALADFDGDGRVDLLAMGMDSAAADRLEHLGLGPATPADYRTMRGPMTVGNRLWLGTGGGGFRPAPFAGQLARTGWSWGVAVFDADNSGRLAVALGAGHESRDSVRDYESQFWRHDIYAGTGGRDAGTEMFFGTEIRARGNGSYGGYHANKFFLRDPATGFRETAHLMGLALRADTRNVVAGDFDGDGRRDLALVTVDPSFQHQILRVFGNRFPATGNWIGFRLREEGAGFSPVGARVAIETPAGRQTRWLVVGDSFRSQSPAEAHFGLGTETRVLRAEIRWPNGRTNLLAAPAINQYHRVRGH